MRDIQFVLRHGILDIEA